MAHKTITISEEAYRVLKRMKRPNESFTKLVLRLAQTRKTSRDLLAFLKRAGPKTELADAIEVVYRERQQVVLREA